MRTLTAQRSTMPTPPLFKKVQKRQGAFSYAQLKQTALAPHAVLKGQRFRPDCESFDTFSLQTRTVSQFPVDRQCEMVRTASVQTKRYTVVSVHPGTIDT